MYPMVSAVPVPPHVTSRAPPAPGANPAGKGASGITIREGRSKAGNSLPVAENETSAPAGHPEEIEPIPLASSGTGTPSSATSTVPASSSVGVVGVGEVVTVPPYTAQVSVAP